MSLDLSSRSVAVALASVGFSPLKPRVSRNDRSGKMVLTWTLAGNQASTAQLLLASVTDPDPAKNLIRVRPESPYLACLYYQEAVAALNTWISTGTRPLVLKSGHASRLLRLMPETPSRKQNDLTHFVWENSTTIPAAAISDPLHAAVAVLCGFVPSPALNLAEGESAPRFVFAAESLTFPGLRLSDLQKATPQTRFLGYDAGEHPACYALACAANLADFIAAEKLALQNPTHQFKGRGTRSALMSENLIAPGADPFFRDALRRHLATS